MNSVGPIGIEILSFKILKASISRNRSIQKENTLDYQKSNYIRKTLNKLRYFFTIVLPQNDLNYAFSQIVRICSKNI